MKRVTCLFFALLFMLSAGCGRDKPAPSPSPSQPPLATDSP